MEMEVPVPQASDVKVAIGHAKRFVADVLSDEQVANLEVEEVELERPTGVWRITIGLHRKWNTPRTRAQEVLENLGATTAGMRRSHKIVEVDRDGMVLSMKDRRD